MRLVPKCNAPDHSFATFLTILNAPYELCEQVDGCRGISFRVSFLFPASSRHLTPSVASLVVRTQFRLRFRAIERSVLFLIVKYSLETGVGNGNGISPRASSLALANAHGYPHQTSPRPNPVSRVDRPSVDCPFDHCAWITTDTYRDQSYGLMSEVLNIPVRSTLLPWPPRSLPTGVLHVAAQSARVNSVGTSSVEGSPRQSEPLQGARPVCFLDIVA